MNTELLVIALLMFLAAALYSSVGHAGASSYLAIMALFSFVPAEMKPTALALNIVVACIGTYRFYHAGFFSWNLFWPFAVTSVPLAYVGGSINLSVGVYKTIVGIVLLFAAARLILSTIQRKPEEIRQPPRAVALAVGAVLGFISGLTGVGGGIFLTPLLLLMKWSETKIAAGVSAAFILVNSISGIIGNRQNVHLISDSIFPFTISVICGGLIGTYLGTQKFDTTTLRRVLAVVLIAAGTKLILT
jgi:uncharacterized membrane protein YfcA